MEIPAAISENIIALAGILVASAVAYLQTQKKNTAETQIADLMSIIATVPGEVAQAQTPTGAGALVLLPNEFQSAEGIEKTIKAIPKDATIDKVDEGTASNGSKYRIVYWTVKR